MAVVGGTGFTLAKAKKSRLVENKKQRMPIIAANGVLVLIPAAIFLNQWASMGLFDTKFYIVQIFELIAGSVNLTLMSMNIRDGLRMTGKLHSSNTN